MDDGHGNPAKAWIMGIYYWEVSLACKLEREQNNSSWILWKATLRHGCVRVKDTKCNIIKSKKYTGNNCEVTRANYDYYHSYDVQHQSESCFFSLKERFSSHVSQVLSENQEAGGGSAQWPKLWTLLSWSRSSCLASGCICLTLTLHKVVGFFAFLWL